MGGYKVTVGGETVRVATLREVESVVMDILTGFLARDPEAAGEGAMKTSRAFAVGSVEYALYTVGSWRTSVTVHGDAVPVVIVKPQTVARRLRGRSWPKDVLLVARGRRCPAPA